MANCNHSGCGGHNHSHNHSHDDHIDDTSGQSLFGLIDSTRLRCLNEAQYGSVKNCIKPWDRRRETDSFLQSNEGDSELLIYVPFTQVVKIRAISILGGRENSAPSKVKVWVNRDDIDFQLAEDTASVQTIDLVADSGGIEVDYPTKISKMQNVSDITLYFSENHGSPSTVIYFLGFKGESTTFRHGIVETVYESKPQAADHKQRGDELTSNSIA